MAHRTKPRRGEVWWVRLDPTIGTETKKTRPAVVLSNDAQNSAGHRVLAAPVTSRISRVYSFESIIDVAGTPSKVMLDQVRCLDQSRISRRVCQVSGTEMRDLERALRVAFALR